MEATTTAGYILITFLAVFPFVLAKAIDNAFKRHENKS